MGNRAEGYTRMEITVAIKDRHSVALWKCENCGRWHSTDNGVADLYGDWCDTCWANRKKDQEAPDGE